MDTRGIQSGSLPELSQVLGKWVDLMEWWVNADPHDAPWWYGERSSLSLFAGAVWQCDGWAIEEYATSKGSKRKPWNGRGDIMFGVDKHEYVAEAKQYWSAMGLHAGNQGIRVKKCLDEARADARGVPAYGAQRLAILFAVPYIPVSQRQNLGERMQTWLAQTATRQGMACAWTFPKAARSLGGTHGYIYPGVLLLVCPL